MQTDCFGQPSTIATAAGVEAWNATQMAFLAHGAKTPDHLGATLYADPEFALGHAVKGIFLLLLGRGELVQTAREACASAKASDQNRPITVRERAFVSALEIWLGGQPSKAVALLDKVLETAPDDTLAMKIAHAIRFVLGDAQGMRRSIEAVMPAYGQDHPGRGYLMGCHAFALEETGEYGRAAAAGSAALAIRPDDAWGLHAVAHVYDMTAAPEKGLRWLSGREAAWAHCNNFRYHVWWHKALMHLDMGQTDVVLDLYDTLIRADKTDDYRDISNATSLLMRLELEGIDVGDRWDELAETSAARTDDGQLIFADLHYLLALVGGRREDATATLVARIAADGARGSTEMEMRMASPGTAAAQGLEAFGEGDYATAFAGLRRARRHMQLAGGSHAQRDVFERLTIDAGIRSGAMKDALGLLEERTTRRAGRDDRFAATRREMIAASPASPLRVPAE
ncbi:tetratricopeptide repeat protein [Rhodobacteraceae bacterium N5(2021)]|uniref:Tetratricopeptide repeat protein 38 n=1 Tax=Gymnodinialimonas phycosphaerae TaxID=2841589 RepID=A0A975TYP7_9RHOB|nr:tetratricopeptide repeat protein [Gymnodinialimonas phycosphaerae]MBY4892994.1 tetratricopeptide repeat protein [Gymnodinialimonas phycosphaerae]